MSVAATDTKEKPINLAINLASKFRAMESIGPDRDRDGIRFLIATKKLVEYIERHLKERHTNYGYLKRLKRTTPHGWCWVPIAELYLHPDDFQGITPETVGRSLVGWGKDQGLHISTKLNPRGELAVAWDILVTWDDKAMPEPIWAPPTRFPKNDK